MSIIIDKEFESLIPPLSDDEFRQLEENCVRDGIRDPLVVWSQGDGNDILVDGHNRFRISAMHSGIRFDIKRMEFMDRDEAKIWIIKNQLGRRNLHELDQAALLAEEEKIESRKSGGRHGYRSDLHGDFVEKFPQSGKTRDIIGEKMGVSGRQYDKLKAINEKGTEALKSDVRNGNMSVNAAYLIATGKTSKSPRQLQREFVERKKEEHEDFKQKKAEAVVNLQEIKEDRETIKILAREFHNDFSKIYSAVFATWMDIENDDNTDDILKSFEPDERNEMLLSLGMSQNLIAKIGGRIKQFE